MQDASVKPHQDHAMLALVRANHHVTHISHLEDLLQSILADTVAALRAQRGTIILADPDTGVLSLKATHAPKISPNETGRPYSKTLVKRCFELGESILCDDVNADEALVMARSIRHGAMASVICALLRTPRKRVGILHLDRGFFDEPFSENDLYYADAIAASVAVGIETAQMIEQQRDQFIETVTTLARTVEMRDQYTGDHTRRVTDYALMLAEELNLSNNEKYQIQIGTPLHDIGKIGIDDAILRKPGKLTADEFEFMKTHTVKGAVMLDAMKHLVPMIPIVRHHHERWDGTGYPDHLHDEQIPLIARIVSIADAFDAMTSNRPYRPAFSAEHAFLELIAKAGTHFDPNCVDAFMRLRAGIEERMKKA
jgi:HD-GYP domain-containing protein (c-di-GMP phosphodiesterase class II)